MPLYEYRCTNCDHVFEVSHEVGGTPGPCPVCGGTPRRIFTSVGLIFKGSGFHTTDYRKRSGTDGAQAKEARGSEPSSAAASSSKESSAKESPSGSGKPTEAAVKSDR